MKKEVEVGGMEIKNIKVWTKVFFRLQGTMLQMFKKSSHTSPFHTISMLKARSGIASDHLKKNVLRLRFGTTHEQYLVNPIGGEVSQIISWFEHFQASANISPDLDHRRMPRVLTISRGMGRYQRHPTVTLHVDDIQEVVMPLLAYQSAAVIYHIQQQQQQPSCFRGKQIT
ncbi:uncharacterized protein BX663DRAFT_496955 [Cokeromyces recurvatus]|uniref:uncharacterized protein n=1 Tax=Cokeromyces recurvatus TaxID=90255 RepID=UPI00221F9562|nr:uncharacterized protein BX663DRAFT_496955 [Cokeromyces recurvatus]KAI7906568.1 hypothetical protein BX663DRAFT_496955 [Cokeromyces recurvatus]